jgi:hypothetical protein
MVVLYDAAFWAGNVGSALRKRWELYSVCATWLILVADPLWSAIAQRGFRRGHPMMY